MKVIFGADAIRYPLTGIGRYAYEVGRRLPYAEGVEHVRYLRGSRVLDALPERPAIGRTQQNNARLRRVVGGLPMFAEVYLHLEAIAQKRVLRGYSDYVFHGPNYYLPPHSGPCVATFHDLSVFSWPECHPAARVRRMQKELPKIMQRVQVLLTDSEFTRQEVAAHFNWPLNRIVVAPLAASSDYRPMDIVEVAPVLSQWGLHFGRYSLFVSSLDPRKNIGMLLDAYERMPDALRLRMPLVVVGFEGWKSEDTIARLRAGERAGWARYLGFVDEASLPALYAGARVFLYPSRYEGFGLPVLEAMAAGTPVICSNAASLPEVTGADGAVLIAVDDADALYEALMRALEDDAWCAEARRHGLKRAAEFSWDKTVTATLVAYNLARQ
jgi:alpha-1,3-rhamnosyl/mannosyltransferase